VFKNINESFDRKFASLTEATLNEEPTPFTLSADDLNDPKEVDFKKIIKRNADAEAKAKAEKERQDRIAAAKEKYKDVLNGIDPNNFDDSIEKLFDALVPSSGMAETVAGELVRAVSRIRYRDWNDGDKFFMGYGLETCGGSAQYLRDMGMTTIDTILYDVHRYADNDDDYTSTVNELTSEVISHILNNPELLAEPNKTDSRDYDSSYIEECQPKLDYDFEIPYEVQKYIDAGYVTPNDIVDILESNFWGIGINYESIDAYGGTVTIYELDTDSYEEVKGADMWDEDYWSYEIQEWESKYGDPDEEDEDDIDESKTLKESPVYDMTPQYDSRKSFYNKARVDDNGNEKTLYSYNTPVAKIAGGKVELLPKWDCSSTTLRHIKEFLKQNGFEASSLAQIKRDYL
jgi:hypothetical protein